MIAQQNTNSFFSNKSLLKRQLKTKIQFNIIRLKKNNQYGSYAKLNILQVKIFFIKFNISIMQFSFKYKSLIEIKFNQSLKIFLFIIKLKKIIKGMMAPKVNRLNFFKDLFFIPIKKIVNKKMKNIKKNFS